MNSAKILIYDGSFNGYLTTIFKAFDEKIDIADIQKNNQSQSGLFSDVETVFTQMDKAKRVWNGISKKSTLSMKNIYFAFLSESKGVELLLFNYISKLFSNNTSSFHGYTEDTNIKVEQLARMVSKEKQKIEAKLRFQLTKDHVYFAPIEPDFNILPLISKHFRSRFSDKQWIIYDTKRKYGLFYDLFSTEMISLDLKEINTHNLLQSSIFSRDTHTTQDVWDNYLANTAIKSRINTKLHTPYVPKKHWKRLRDKTAV